MGIVRDRQVPCTCETYNGQVGPSSDHIKDTSESGTVPTDLNHHHHEQYLRYSQKYRQSDTERRPLFQEEPFTEGFQSTGGPGGADQQAGQTGSNSERQTEIISSGLHSSKMDSRNEQQYQNKVVSSGELSQDEEALHSETQPSSLPENKHEVADEGSKDVTTNSDESRRFESHEQTESVIDSRYNETLEHLHGGEDHRFATGIKENYQSQDEGDASIAQSLNQSQTLHRAPGPPGDSFKSTALSNERVQGSGPHILPGTEAPSNVKISSKPFERPNYPKRYSKEKYELSPEYKVPSKIMAVGKAAENFKTEEQEKNSHGENSKPRIKHKKHCNFSIVTTNFLILSLFLTELFFFWSQFKQF